MDADVMPKKILVYIHFGMHLWLEIFSYLVHKPCSKLAKIFTCRHR